jgi:hypothetical protein
MHPNLQRHWSGAGLVVCVMGLLNSFTVEVVAELKILPLTSWSCTPGEVVVASIRYAYILFPHPCWAQSVVLVKAVAASDNI